MPFEFVDDLFNDADFRNTLEFPNSTSTYTSNSYMRHEKHSQNIEREPVHIENISIPSPSMSSFNVSSNSTPNLSGELMAILAITMTYASPAKDLN